MGKSWVYRGLKGGEIPSIKLGRTIKVKRADLDAYLENMRYSPPENVPSSGEGSLVLRGQTGPAVSEVPRGCWRARAQEGGFGGRGRKRDEGRVGEGSR
jgi:excisionase family DNA binding protein